MHPPPQKNDPSTSMHHPQSKAPKTAVVLGEFGVLDSGDNSNNNTDTTQWAPADVAWLQMLNGYAKKQLGATPSWFWWSWNANSGDTKGLVGPTTTWREVQWAKVRLLVRQWGLRPWFCTPGLLPVATAKSYGCA